MVKNAWCIVIFVYLLRNSAVSTFRLGGGGNGEASWSSSGSGNGGIQLSTDSSSRLSLGSLFGGMMHAFEGKGRGSGSVGESSGIGSRGDDFGASLNFNGGLGGSSLSTHSSINLRSILKTLFTLPIKIPARIFNYAIRIIWNVATFNISLIRIPVSVIRRIVTAFYKFIKIVVRSILNIICNIGSFNIDIIVGIINRIKSIVAWVIRQTSSAQIFGIKIGFNAVSFFKHGLEDAVEGSLKFMAWILITISRAFKGTFDILHIKAILKLPGIRNILGLVRWVGNYGFEIVATNVESAAKFVDSIIYQHQDFFIPIFHYILNFALAISNAVHQIQYGGGWSTGIKATLGNLSITLGPVLSGYWKIHGLGGQSFGNNGTFPFGAGYYDVGSDNKPWAGNIGIGQNEGKTPGQGWISSPATHTTEGGNSLGGSEETSSSPQSTGGYNSRYGEKTPEGEISESAQASSGGSSSGSSIDGVNSGATGTSSEGFTPGSGEATTGESASGIVSGASEKTPYGSSGVLGKGTSSWSKLGEENDSSTNDDADSSGGEIDFHEGIVPTHGVTGGGSQSEGGIGSVSDDPVGSGSTDSTGWKSSSESTTGIEIGSVLDDGGDSDSKGASDGETSPESETGAVTEGSVTDSGIVSGGGISLGSNGEDSSGSSGLSSWQLSSESGQLSNIAAGSAPNEKLGEQNGGSDENSPSSEGKWVLEKTDETSDKSEADTDSRPKDDSSDADDGNSRTVGTTEKTVGSGELAVTPGSGSEGSTGGNSSGFDLSSKGDLSGSIDSSGAGGSSGGGSNTPAEWVMSDSSNSNGGVGSSGSIQVSESDLSGGSKGEDSGAKFDKITGLGDLGEPSGLATGPPGLR